uniref:TF-B3 domain-containing protein n=1 Tax=Kalanchoe fedtschenkoi TaxID=63787 RepID=A0A7N0TPW2_KALFE
MRNSAKQKQASKMATATTSAVKSSDGRKPHFIVTFAPHSSSGRLEIPHKFNQHIEGKTNVWVLLSGRGGKVWRVGLVRQHQTLFLNEGWSGFVRDSSVELGDTLVFEYNGDWQFEVYIFDGSGCEKEVRECMGNLGSNSRKRRERDEDESSGCVVKKKESIVCRSCNVDCVNEEPADLSTAECHPGAPVGEPLALIVYEEPGPSNLINGHPNYPPATALPSLCKFQSGTSGSTTKYKDVAYKYTSQGKGSKLKFSASEEKISRSFKSEFPHFVRVMKIFNVSGSFTLKIPYKFSTEHLPQCKTKVVLQTCEGSCWTVNSVPTTKVHTCHTFCGGWVAFVRANHIEAGDACIFQLVSECKMLVHILKEGRQISESNGGEKSKFRSLASLSNDIKKLGLGSKNSSHGYGLPQEAVDWKAGKCLSLKLLLKCRHFFLKQIIKMKSVGVTEN